MVNNLRFIDLFCGVGGFRVALEKLGNTCVFSSEINSSAQKVYLRNFGELPYGDIRTIDLTKIPDFDILTAGFPCQPFSLNGKKEGFKDETRGTLFFDIAEILKVKQPKMLLLENVKGIVTHDKGNTLKTINSVLTGLGYSIHTKVLNTYDFGLPQYRERWYCVGFLNPIAFEFPVGNRKGSTLKEVIDPDHHDDELLLPKEERDRIDYHFKHYLKTPRVEHPNKHYNPKSKKGRYGVFSYLKPDNSLRFHTGDVAKSQIQDDYYVSLDGVAPTLIATRAPKMWDLRRHMSVLECQKLQGFPDSFDFTDVSIKVAKKQLGNAVTVKLVEEIAKNMFSYFNKNIPDIRSEESKKAGTNDAQLSLPIIC
jgi:DNA (cytosine-5)-methyltransferase 1